MKTIFFVLVLLVAGTSEAAIKRYFQDAKWPSQKSVEMQTITNPAAAGTADVLSAFAGATSAAVATRSTFVAQPDVPRNLVITPAGTTGDVEACVVTVTGTNFNGATITETFSFLADASTATTGAKAFKTVSLVSWAASCESGGYAATWSIGYGEKIGLNHCLDAAGDIFFSKLNGAKEGTAPTMVADNDEIEKNTADYSGAMNGSNDFDLVYFQNFRCNP